MKRFASRARLPRSLACGALALAGAILAGCPQEKPKPAAETNKSAAPEHAPDIFRVAFDTTQGSFVVEVNRAWAPYGADHFFELVRAGYYNGDGFYRVVRRYIVQWGINGDPSTTRLWSDLRIPDDPVKEKNRRGTITFARGGPQSRTTQVFINLRDNTSLDGQGFAPFGRVISGMDVVDHIYGGYGDMPPRGEGPDPAKIGSQGNSYLETHFPRLDYIRKASIQ